MARKTLLQRRLVEALPKHNFKVKPAAIEAGYAENTADQHGKRIVQSKGFKELAGEVGFTMSVEELLGEYEYIAKQKKDLTNKRVVVENILAHKDPKLDMRQQKPQGGNTYNTLNLINLSPEDRRKRMAELSNTLLKQPLPVGEGNDMAKQ